MVRLGLGAEWKCLFANDIDEMKAETYRENFGLSPELVVKDIHHVNANIISKADMAWASFPCQDLSLAGNYNGLKGERSIVFWEFWRLMKTLIHRQDGPSIIALENVRGALTSRNGLDFVEIGEALAKGGYRFGAIVIDAVHFVPQSRPRLFIIGVRSDLEIPSDLISDSLNLFWHTDSLKNAYNKLPQHVSLNWLWWSLPYPPRRTSKFSDLIEEAPTGIEWNTEEETEYILRLMSETNKAKVEKARAIGRRMIGGVYRRTRKENGGKFQRAEVRFDDIAGCLRTPSGGSSRQTILEVEGQRVRSRLLSPREAARLMGMPDDYRLPQNYNSAYHLAGDGVVVPVISFLAKHLLERVLLANRNVDAIAAA
jgi:DNA (cytosine-5)-methyltransferase 1